MHDDQVFIRQGSHRRAESASPLARLACSPRISKTRRVRFAELHECQVYEVMAFEAPLASRSLALAASPTPEVPRPCANALEVGQQIEAGVCGPSDERVSFRTSFVR
jgi:hypothetical protein